MSHNTNAQLYIQYFRELIYIFVNFKSKWFCRSCLVDVLCGDRSSVTTVDFGMLQNGFSGVLIFLKISRNSKSICLHISNIMEQMGPLKRRARMLLRSKSSAQIDLNETSQKFEKPKKSPVKTNVRNFALMCYESIIFSLNAY